MFYVDVDGANETALWEATDRDDPRPQVVLYKCSVHPAVWDVAVRHLAELDATQAPAPQACPTRSPYTRIPCDLPDDAQAHADGHAGIVGYEDEDGPTPITWPTTVEDHDRWGTRL